MAPKAKVALLLLCGDMLDLPVALLDAYTDRLACDVKVAEEGCARRTRRPIVSVAGDFFGWGRSHEFPPQLIGKTEQ
jgi:hypothetical protein